ncbi:hypothetical protein T12_1760 [Trichinella patagoniensis]|uniref:Uncharacterized protein n=1 Tax=Trichinella patagoniensis TaxID=990121 RepID=A0A0V0YUL6_9BILA|nr:hypothetical protein T12_1760 [Trichinella patagoniensis]
MLGYHNISYLINASIYLVKGGRLGLMPGVLFHSCRPSFRHTGVMFPDFAFLTRLVLVRTERCAGPPRGNLRAGLPDVWLI